MGTFMLQRIACFFLTPFSEELNSVFYKAVKPTVKEAAYGMSSITVDVLRADEQYETREEKVERIRRSIKEADFLIADLTGFNANVMWEVGFAHASGKDVILISQNIENAPFNIRTRDIIKYENTAEGLLLLAKKLEPHLGGLISEMARLQRTCYFAKNSARTFELVKDVFRQHEVNSICSVFLEKEIARGNSQFSNLKRGIYEVRKERPSEEIVDTYSKVLSLLSTGSKFDAISCVDFWLNITESGNNLDYNIANRTAAQQGASIRRIFLVDKSTYQKGQTEDVEFRSILRRHHQTIQGYPNVHLRLFMSDQYKKDSSRTYRNSALIEHGTERLLLEPTYGLNQNANRMLTTHFYYHDLDPSKVHNNSDNIDRFQRCRGGFEALWNESQPLKSEDYD